MWLHPDPAAALVGFCSSLCVFTLDADVAWLSSSSTPLVGTIKSFLCLRFCFLFELHPVKSHSLLLIL